jgi:hypothetical protein
MLLVKYFSREVYKLRGFLTQIKIKIINKGLGLLTVIKQITYIRLFLLRRVLEWFKPYFTITDLINRIVQVRKRDLHWFRINTQDTELIKPVKL